MSENSYEKEKNTIIVTVRVRPISEKEKSEGNRLCVKVDPKYQNTLTL